MALRLKKKPLSDEVPTSSFGDIAFLLIIFFILVTSLRKTEGFEADLPAGEKAESKVEKTTAINLRADRIILNDKAVTMPELREALKALELDKKEGDDRIVMLEAVGDVKYQDYFEVMAAITQAGGVVGVVREDKPK